MHQLSVVSILSLFYILSPVPLFISVFLNVCNSYNRSSLLLCQCGRSKKRARDKRDLVEKEGGRS